MSQLFADREREISFLEGHYASGRAELIILYGRRRVGKTELCLKFSEGKPRAYFMADSRPETQLIEELRKELGRIVTDESWVKLAITDWLDLFREFRRLNTTRRPLLIIDEFPALIESNRATPSIFQKVWDEILADSDTMLILLGSSVAMMETEVLSYRSPLYGRRTGQWRVEPLSFTHLADFLPRYDAKARMEAYGCLGGVPAYLTKFDPSHGVWENMESKILSKGEFLYEEADFLLREELREPRNYAAILQAIAGGARSHGDIIGQTGMEKSVVSRYLATLEDLGFTRREYPVGSRPKQRKGAYSVSDQYLGFWFRYVFPNRSALEAGETSRILEGIKKDYGTYLGRVFEAAIPQLLAERQRRGGLPFTFTQAGRWWHRDQEIDVVALDESAKAATFLEVKWGSVGRLDARRILNDLAEKAEAFRWEREKEAFGIVALQIDGKQEMRSEGYIAMDMDDLIV